MILGTPLMTTKQMIARQMTAKEKLQPTPQKAAQKRMSWPQFTSRFGETVRKAGVVVVPRVLLTGIAALKIKPIHAIVLLQLIACWGSSGSHPFPSRRLLRKWIGCNKRTLDRAITQLVKLGLVEKHKRARMSR